MTPTVSLSVVAVILLAASSASAEPVAAKAEALFRDGQRLFAQKRYDEACPKLAFSARMVPSSATEIALGFCYEAQGKTASAWAAYTAVIPLAQHESRADRARVASGRVKALNSRLSRMTFTIDKTTGALDGLELREDGVLLDKAAWEGRPVDPGEHDIEVQAPGYVTYSTKYTVGAGAQEETLAIPRLTTANPTPAEAAPVAPPPPPPSAPLNIPWRTVAIATGSVGAASVLVGAILGGVALSKVNAAEKACPSSPCGNAGAVAENSSAGGLANASTGMFVVGGALVGTGVLMYFFLPPAHESAPSAPHGEPVVELGYLGWRGTF